MFSNNQFVCILSYCMFLVYIFGVFQNNATYILSLATSFMHALFEGISMSWDIGRF